MNPIQRFCEIIKQFLCLHEQVNYQIIVNKITLNSDITNLTQFSTDNKKTKRNTHVLCKIWISNAPSLSKKYTA